MKHLILIFLLLIPNLVYAVAKCDGTDDVITISSSSDLAFPDSDWTFAGWFYYDSSGSGFDHPISNGAWNVGDHINIYIDKNDDGVTFGMRDSNSDSWYLTDIIQPLAGETWHHFIFMRSGTTLYFYHNNTELDSTTMANFDDVTASDFFFVLKMVQVIFKGGSLKSGLSGMMI